MTSDWCTQNTVPSFYTGALQLLDHQFPCDVGLAWVVPDPTTTQYAVVSQTKNVFVSCRCLCWPPLSVST